MHHHPAAVASLAVLAALALPAALAGSKGDPAPPAEAVASGSRWSLSVGATVRSLESDFHLRGPSYRVTPPRSTRSGREAGLYGGTGVTNYDNGSVGPGIDFLIPGVAVASGGSVTPSGRAINLGFIQIPINNRTFTGSQRIESSAARGEFYDASTDGEDTGFGPEVTLRYTLTEPKDGLRVDLLAGYAFVPHEVEESTSLGEVSVWRTRENRIFSYQYDSVPVDEFLLFIPPTVITDADALPIPPFVGNPFRDPRTGRRAERDSDLLARFRAVGSVDLEVRLHELRLAPEIQFDLTDRLTVGIAAGPTLNIIDADLEAETRIYQSGRKAPVYRSRSKASETQVAVGAMADLVALYDLTRSGNLFLEGRVGYHWVDSVNISAGPASAEIDASSFTASLGLGWRF